jgi:hypothetical protein
MHQILSLIDKLIILLPIILTLAACGGGGTGGEEITANKWTWISGSKSTGQPILSAQRCANSNSLIWHGA